MNKDTQIQSMPLRWAVVEQRDSETVEAWSEQSEGD
jgi:hypothetical protein